MCGTFQVLKQFAYILIIQTGTIAQMLRLDVEGSLCLRSIGRESPPDQIVERLTKRNTPLPAKRTNAFQNVFVEYYGVLMLMTL